MTDAGHSSIHENFSVRGRVANGAILATDNGLGRVGASHLAVKNDTGVWCNDSGHLTCLALEGLPVPGFLGTTGQPNA